VCEIVVNDRIRHQLGTVYEEKVHSFESDPCGVQAIYGKHGFEGVKRTRGNCTQPNECTCLCKESYSKEDCSKNNKNCKGPWQDPLVKYRNVLEPHGPEFEFGSTSCAHGYQGDVDNYDHFTSCHMTIYVPSSLEYNSITLMVSLSVSGFVVVLIYYFLRERLRRRYLLAKIEKRRNRRSEEPLLGDQGGAFLNN
jgi:hypothetical protein